ncbi:peptide synthetase, putative [Coccidioides posadasii C735 delta SOWgp]|uniref:Peptide synthetase, putative n=1 Tax=Coccidioides posadasii (strain C735) TaxID=222929 RepID=C5P844_COCP7|nr:peptide synthetase, putative [Coccidioides posadasii C735 delta SOWgp]EER26815.1 peptide synthetase, putative [Coccidioides posadasii C735 delta SOWgp]|eukprot:XP_003068960.1 peptide synthetase, putative [Coccidioides posadasii C735 delta SOWgp]
MTVGRFPVSLHSRTPQTAAMKDTHFQTSLRERTSKYWSTFLHDFKPCYFPSLLEGDGPSTSTTTTLQRGDFQEATVKLDNIYHSTLQEFCSEHQVTLGSFFQTAWAVVVACYAGVEDISFGYLEGDNSDVVICRTDITAEQMLHQIMIDMMEHLENARTRPIGITEVQNLVGLEGQLLSDSALQIQRRGSEQSGSMSQADGNFDIQAHALINDDDSVAVAIRTKASKFSRSRTADVAHAFAKTLVEMLTAANPQSISVGDLDTFTRCDYDKVMNWNPPLPSALDSCFHQLFEQIARKTPDAPAICSWCGHDYTYRELDTVSTKLANHLNNELGVVVPETPVLICFDKSSIAMVSMLSIFKAGGAFVAIDPAYPISRIQAIVQATNASLVLVQPIHRYLFEGIFMEKSIVALDSAYLDGLPLPSTISPCRVIPSNTAYIHFTSGSTGIPKGIMIEHRALCTAVSALASPMRITSTSRVLQFAAYIFDLSFGDIFVTLSQGGCICVPSEHERVNDLVGAILRMDVNTACLIPSVARILHPEQVPGLQTLLLGGEALLQENLERWADKVVLNAMYGPSECTVWCTSQTDLRVDSLANNIGRGRGARLWVTRSVDHNRLVPAGCIGELLIEGPVLARGYLNPEQTRQSFVENPSWAVSSSSERRRFYKTGDLVRFNADGTLSFIGRKDTQIKLHGRRIEIGEIEHHLASHSLVQQSMVMFPSAGVHAKRLVAIVVVVNSTSANTVNKGGKEGEASIVMAKDPCTSELAKIKEFISSKLPSYMLPQAWVVVQDIPTLISGKMNRVLVKKFVESLTISTTGESQPKEGKGLGEAAQQDHHSEEKEYDQNDDGDAIEKRLRDIWGQVLNIGDHGEKNITDDVIRLDQTFSGLGGDSFSAMDLVARCRAEGLVLTVQDVLSNSSGITIQQMARVIKKHRSALTKNISMMAALKLRPVWWDA